jgi:phosphate transport system permease protein
MSAGKQKMTAEDIQLRRSYRAEAVANGFIWLAAGITIVVLVAVIGYILFHGFYADTIKGYTVLPVAERSFQVDSGESMSIVVNEKVRVRDLTYKNLRDLFGSPSPDWTVLSEQDLAAVPYAYTASAYTASAYTAKDPRGASLAAFLFGPDGGFSSSVTYQNSPADILDKVAKTPGAVGLVPASMAASAKGVRVISLRRIVAVVNPAVVEVKQNRKFTSFTEASLKALFSGTAQNWNQLKGIDLPISFIAPPSGSVAATVLASAGYGIPPSAQRPSTADEQVAELGAAQGGVSFTTFREAEDRKLLTVLSERRETGPNLSINFLLEEPKAAGRVGGISSIILNTVYMIILTLLFSTPVGIAAAIYLIEYAKQGKMLDILRLGTETLAGIPSIIFGLFGFIVFVSTLHLGIGLLSGTLTITLMILPTIIRTSEEALKSVPRDYREGSLALGATKLQTIFKVVVPAAAPGILTGIILAIGRAVGETAALLFTMGFDYRLVKDFRSSARMLSVHLYQMVQEGISFNRAFATATVLIIIILIVNLAATRLIGRMNRMSGK